MNNSDSVARWLERWVVRGGFLHSVLVLLSGTALAHILTALALPILTRLYTPSEFSALAVFSSALSIISVAACLRFDIAVSMPKQDSQAFRILLLASGSLLSVSLILLAIILVDPAELWKVAGMEAIESYLWLMPIAVLSTGIYSIFQNWFIRKREFGFIAKSRIAQSVVSIGTQIALFSMGPLGLLIGYVFNPVTACLVLGYRLVKDKYVFLNRKRLPTTFYIYRNFPKYSTWEALANSAAIQVPIIMIAALGVGAEAGYLLLAMSIIQAPMSLFGNAIAQVYLSHAPTKYRKGQLGKFSTEILAGLLKTGVGPLIALAILAPSLFGIIFGSVWERSGWLVAWMTPWFVFQFLATPLSMGIHVAGRQKIAFVLQIGGMLWRVLLVWLAAKFYQGYISEIYAISGAIFYFLYFFIILHVVKASMSDVLQQIKKNFLIIFLWSGGALIILIILRQFS